jgi:trehalose 6-phosphate phosphatase
MMDLPGPRSLQRHDALFLDFDGTLAAIARRPEDVVVPSYLPELLTKTASALSGAMALISGRTIASVDQLVDGSVRAVAGIHGLEHRSADGVIHQQSTVSTAALLNARKALAEAVGRWPRAFIEHKGLAFALHYRLEPAAKRELTVAAQTAVAASAGALKLIDGNCVLEVMICGSDKGSAIRTFLAEPPFAGRHPIFIGDDITDEAAFREVESQGGTAVIVGDRRPTAARYAINNVADVHTWIGQLTAAQRTSLNA